MPSLGTLAAGLKASPHRRRSEAYIVELDDNDQPVTGQRPGQTGLGFQYLKFQYFPETISDGKAVSYQTKEIPGGSLPLYQYTGSGERTISFTAVFTTDIDHYMYRQTDWTDYDQPVTFGDQLPNSGQVTRRLQGKTAAVEAAHERMKATGIRERNPYIPGALFWLRRFMFPRYGELSDVGVPITRPPHKLLLFFTDSELEILGGTRGFSAPGGGILCVMTQCDISYEAFFPSGNIRIATVSLGFSEIPQRGGMVRFPTSDADGMENWYRLYASRMPVSGGR